MTNSSQAISNPQTVTENKSFQSLMLSVIKPPVITMLFLGFSAGLPILLIFGTLSLWLRESGLERGAVTYFSWAALGYSFKFVWAPLVDKLPLPLLTSKLGKRRSWMLLAQLSIATAMLLMAMSDPASPSGLTGMAIGAVLLGFSSATQDIVIDAYRIEAAEVRLQALMSSTYVAGYRIGMIFAGAVALYLAEFLGSSAESYLYSAWRNTYIFMAALMLVGITTTLLIKEPAHKKDNRFAHKGSDYLRFMALFIAMVVAFILTFVFVSDITGEIKTAFNNHFNNAALAGFIGGSLQLLASVCAAIAAGFALSKLGIVPNEMLQGTYIEPVTDFFRRYQKAAFLILILVGLYRISDIVLGAIANIFYQDMGFSKSDIATVTKVFGLWMTILGGFLGGFLSIKYGVMRILMIGAVMTVLTNLMFILLHRHPDILMLYVVISADNITAGLASAALIAYLSSLVNVQFTAMQYAIFSSLMSLLPKIIAGYSGSMVDALGYEQFFLYVSLLGVPIFALVWLAQKYTRVRQNQN